jgi:hypothetical protein
LEKGKLKRTLIASVHFQRAALEDLSLSGGASIRSSVFQAEHHLCFGVDCSPSDMKKATRWVALVWLAMRLGI